MPKRKNNRHHKYSTTLVLFFLASCFLILGIFFKTLDVYNNIEQQMLTAQSKSEYSAMTPKSIKINRLHLNLPIEGTDIINGKWPISKYAVSYLKSSEKLAGNGTTIIYGHNKTNIFGQLNEVKIGDKIGLTLSDNRNVSYTVYQTIVVRPNEVSALKTNTGSMLILYTCTGFADSKRLVVKAKLT